MGNQSVARARKERQLSDGLGFTGCLEMRSPGGDTGQRLEREKLVPKSWRKYPRKNTHKGVPWDQLSTSEEQRASSGPLAEASWGQGPRCTGPGKPHMGLMPVASGGLCGVSNGGVTQLGFILEPL